MRAGVNLCNGYGGTEFGNPVLPWDRIPRESTEPDTDWYWYRVAEDANLRFEPQGDGSYELVVVVSRTVILMFTVLDPRYRRPQTTTWPRTMCPERKHMPLRTSLSPIRVNRICGKCECKQGFGGVLTFLLALTITISVGRKDDVLTLSTGGCDERSYRFLLTLV